MEQPLFTATQFACFQVEGVENRMQAIRSAIQPVFRYYGEQVSDDLSQKQGERVPVHIAKHIRRKVHPPQQTWVAIGGDQRGYKKYPHFQIGINERYVSVWLAMIEQPLFEKEVMKEWKARPALFDQLDDEYVLNRDHTQFTYHRLSDVSMDRELNRVMQVKKVEMMIGKVALASDPLLQESMQLRRWILDTVNNLYPLYESAMICYRNK